MKRIEVCEMIQYRLAGGVPSNDFRPVLHEINAFLDVAVASAAMRNYTDSASLDVEFVSDAFTATYKVILTKDTDSGYYKGTLPALTIAVPRGYDITSAQVLGTGYSSKPLVRVSPQQLDYFGDLPKPPGAIFYWPEGIEIWLDSDFNLVGKTLSIRMTGSAGKRLLTDELLCPPDYLSLVIEWVMNKFMQPSAPAIKDSSNDGLNIR